MNVDIADIKRTQLQIKNLVSQLIEDSKINGDTRNIRKLGYSRKEAVAALSLSKRTIDYLISGGVLKTVRAGNRVIILSKSADRLLEIGAVPYPKSSRK